MTPAQMMMMPALTMANAQMAMWQHLLNAQSQMWSNWAGMLPAMSATPSMTRRSDENAEAELADKAPDNAFV